MRLQNLTNVSPGLRVDMLLALNVVNIIATSSCAAPINTTGQVGLHVPRTAKCIAVGCQIVPRSASSTSYNLHTPFLTLWLTSVLDSVRVQVVNLSAFLDIAADISCSAGFSADDALASYCA